MIGGVLSAAAIGITLSVSAAALIREQLPDVALRWAPYDGRVAAKSAEFLLATQPGQIEQAKALAQRALKRDPTVVSAWRTLALGATVSGNPDRAIQIMLFANKISRRDLATQLWLIDENVRHDDVRGALRHYDFALRTSKQGSDILLPTLVAALSEPSLNRVIGDLLLTRPPWLAAFFYALNLNASSGESAATLLERLRRKGYSDPIPNLAALPARLVQKGEYAAAYRVHRALQAGSTGIGEPADQFAKAPKLLPFDWDLAAANDIRGEPRLLNTSDPKSSLYVYAANGAVGVAAKRLMLWPAGDYRFSSPVRSTAGPTPERLEWAIRCAGSDAMLLNLDLAKNPAGPRFADFTIPAQKCEAQWVELSVRAADGSVATEVWIGDVAIKPRALATQPRSSMTRYPTR